MIQTTRRCVLTVTMLAFSLGLHAGTAGAQSLSKYPERSIRLVVPYPPGGPTDLTARVVAAEMGKTMGQSVVVDNRAGASGMIGSEAVARAEPDGYTILGNASIHVINPSVYKKMAFNAIDDFVPISQLAQVPLVLVVPVNSPIKSVGDLVAYAKQKGGKLNFGSSGVASAPHLAGESFKRLAGIEMQHIAYKGSAPALQDLAGGQIDLMFDSMPSATALIDAGKLRPIAVTTLNRAKARPDLPTIAESGYPNFDISTWYGYWAPKGTPPAVVEILAKNVQVALKNPQVIEAYQKMGAEPVGSTPAEFAAFNKSETKKWADIVKLSGATLD